MVRTVCRSALSVLAPQEVATALFQIFTDIQVSNAELIDDQDHNKSISFQSEVPHASLTSLSVSNSVSITIDGCPIAWYTWIFDKKRFDIWPSGFPDI